MVCDHFVRLSLDELHTLKKRKNWKDYHKLFLKCVKVGLG